MAKRAGTRPAAARGGGKKAGAARSSTNSASRKTTIEKPGSRVREGGNVVTLVKSAKASKLARRADKSGPKFPSNLPVPPPPVPTDGKPRKNQAGLTTRELEHFRELLLAKRRELVGDMTIQLEPTAMIRPKGSASTNSPATSSNR